MAPKATLFTTTVEIHVRNLKFKYKLKGLDINEMERTFTAMTNYELLNSAVRPDYNTIRLTLKWAIACNGKLHSVTNTKTTVTFTFSFTSLNSMVLFVKDLNTNVY